MLALLLFFLVLILPSTQAVSPASTRVEAPFTLVALPSTPPADICPSRIDHEVISTYRGLDPSSPSRVLDGIRWRHLKLNNQSCAQSLTSATATRLFPQETSPPGTPPELAQIFFLTGEDNTPRRCGNFQAALPAHYFFTDDLPRFRERLTEAGLLPGGTAPILDEALRGMIYMFGRQFQPGGVVSLRTTCVYLMTTPTPSPSPSPSQQPVEEDGVCFPGNAKVSVRGGGFVRMRDLQVGDFVSVGGGLYSPVVFFGHFSGAHGEAGVWDFVEIHIETSDEDEVRVLRISKGHYVRTRESWSGLKRADEFQSGDSVMLEGGIGIVNKVRLVRDAGLFSPVTAHGDVVVGGVIASCYTEALDPSAAHAASLPMRAAFQASQRLKRWEWNGRESSTWYVARDLFVRRLMSGAL